MTTTKRTSLPNLFTFQAGPGPYRFTRISGEKFICTDAHIAYDPARHNADWTEVDILRNLNNGTWTFLEDLTPAGFKVGDRVKVVDDSTCGYINNGQVLTVEAVNSKGQVQVEGVSFHYYEPERFELDAPAVPKLKLPLAVTRSGGSKVVLIANPAGGITMVYADSGDTYDYSEAEVLRRLEEGIWTVTGAESNATLTADVETAKTGLQAAKEAVAAAEAALAKAEEALANNKPYLA